MDVKTLFGVVAVVLTFVGYAPYIRDVATGRTKPHVYSWFLWGFVTAIAFALQATGQAGWGAWVTLAASILCWVVFLVSFFKKGKKDIVFIDTVFLVLTFVALGLWLIAKQPVISTILITLIDFLGFAPTIRKSWNNPHSETLSFYMISTVRFVLASFALERYDIVTALYPIAWIFGNGLFGLMLVVRRKQLAKR